MAWALQGHISQVPVLFSQLESFWDHAGETLFDLFLCVLVFQMTEETLCGDLPLSLVAR